MHLLNSMQAVIVVLLSSVVTCGSISLSVTEAAGLDLDTTKSIIILLKPGNHMTLFTWIWHIFILIFKNIKPSSKTVANYSSLYVHLLEIVFFFLQTSMEDVSWHFLHSSHVEVGDDWSRYHWMLKLLYCSIIKYLFTRLFFCFFNLILERTKTFKPSGVTLILLPYGSSPSFP